MLINDDYFPCFEKLVPYFFHLAKYRKNAFKVVQRVAPDLVLPQCMSLILAQTLEAEYLG